MSSVSSVNSLLSSSTGNTGSSVDVSSILAATAGVSTPGIDVNAAVAAALYAARAPERLWQAEQVTLSNQTTALTAIQAAANALSSDVTALNSLSGPLSARVVASSNANAVTATAVSGSTAGNHTVSVNHLAQTASWYSDLASSATAALPQTAFTITAASGASATFSTGSGVNTLQDLASAISSNASLGVTATVVSDAVGARLAIRSNASGEAADFSVSSAPATTTSWSSPGLSSGETLGANSFVLTTPDPLSGEPVNTTVTTTDGETLAQVAEDINGKSLGVTVSVTEDSAGSHLTIVSGDGTTPFTISEPGFGFSQAAQGMNASLTVDGVPVSSASNTVTGAISGVTLNLLAPTGGTANLQVASDTTLIGNAINQFVSDYNSAITLVNAQFAYSSSTSSEGAVGSDPTVRTLQITMMRALSYVNQPPGGTATVATLGSMGISVNDDGTLALNATTLNSMLSNNAADLQNFFQGASLNGFASSFATQLSAFTEPGVGAFTVDLRSIHNTNDELTKQISDYESGYIANQQKILTAMYSQAEIALQQLPTQMAQIQAELGNNTKSSG
jgi:flagellar hook-associated protein 2